MSDQAKNERAADEEVVENGAEQAATGSEADYEAVMRLVKENEELKDRALRMAADMENLRRRTAKEIQDARAYAIANFAREMLSVSDNLARALDAVPAEARAAADSGLAALVEGVEMTERAMLAGLERHGVKRLEPQDQKFDPNFHQAMFEVPNPNVPAGTVVQVVQPGYSIGDRVLRPAMVGVSTGGPKQPAAANDQPETKPEPVDERAEKDA